MKNRYTHGIVRLGLLLFFLIATNVRMFGADDGVILTLKSGEELGFVFSSRPTIMVKDELLITLSDGTKVSYSFDAVRNVRFGAVDPTGVEETPGSQDVVFRFSDGMLRVYGLPVGENVAVYSVNGQHQVSRSQESDGEVLSIPLSAKGVLVVRTSTGVSYKIMNP